MVIKDQSLGLVLMFWSSADASKSRSSAEHTIPSLTVVQGWLPLQLLPMDINVLYFEWVQLLPTTTGRVSMSCSSTGVSV